MSRIGRWLSKRERINFIVFGVFIKPSDQRRIYVLVEVKHISKWKLIAGPDKIW